MIEQDYAPTIEEMEEICADATGEPKFKVHFLCADCRIPWSYSVTLLTQALLKASKDGCPLCNQKSRIILTHHEELLTEKIPDLNEFVAVCMFNDKI